TAMKMFQRNSQAAGRRRPQPIERPRFNGRTDIWISFLPAWISFRSVWISFRLAWISFRPAWNSFRPAWNRFLAAQRGGHTSDRLWSRQEKADLGVTLPH